MTSFVEASLSLKMPAEWAEHEATWIAWPHNVEDWPGKFEPIDAVYCDFVSKLSRVEKVRILVAGPGVERRIRPMLEDFRASMDAVEFFHVPTNRSWTRDFLPTFVNSKSVTGKEDQPLMLDWAFNGWAKYKNHQLDDSATSKLAASLAMERMEPVYQDRRIVLEGGGIEVNGAGLVLTTEEWLLSDQQVRNPGFMREDYEAIFTNYLGAKKTIWLKRGIVGDDTHGHIDDLARFVDEKTVVTVLEEDSSDENYEITQENLAILKAARISGNKKLDVHTLPMPKPVYFQDQRLPASYANFYVANSLVLVPTFNDPADRIALNKLADLFAGRQVVGIHSLDLVLGLGTLHCMTQQQPKL
jgi:agmatine deiminase